MSTWPVKVGLSLGYMPSLMDGDKAAELARAAEAAGFESVWTSEHVVVPGVYESKYPYSPNGQMSLTVDTDMADPLELAGWFAAAAPRLHVGTGVVILPLHDPLIMAKRAATIDRLTGGRLLLGVGVGWLREEYEALGVPFAGRAARAEDYLCAMQALWAGRTHYDGTHVRFDDVVSRPRPHGDTVHVVMGGHSPAAARRAGRLAAGFYPLGTDIATTEQLVKEARAAAAAAGRDPDVLEVTTSGTLRPADAAALIEAGVNRFIFQARQDTPDEVNALADAFERKIVAALG